MMKTLADLMSLKGRSAVVTGGAGHIGLAVCEALMETGCCVTVLDRDGDGLHDCEELFYGTVQRGADTDGDGIPDPVEIRFGLNPGEVDSARDGDFDRFLPVAHCDLALVFQGTGPAVHRLQGGEADVVFLQRGLEGGDAFRVDARHRPPFKEIGAR